MTLQLFSKFASGFGNHSPGDIIYEQTTAGTYDVDLDAGVYTVILVGGGAGGIAAARRSSSSIGGSAGGGSAGALSLNYRVTAGTYSVTVGVKGEANVVSAATNTTFYGHSGTSSSFSTYCSAGYGVGGSVQLGTSPAGTTAGTGGSNTITTTPLLTNFNYSGNSGTAHNDSTESLGGSAVYSTYGAGGAAKFGTTRSASSGTGGYIKIIFVSY